MPPIESKLVNKGVESMSFQKVRNACVLGTYLAAIAVASPAMADEAADGAGAPMEGGAIVVTGTRATYNN